MASEAGLAGDARGARTGVKIFSWIAAWTILVVAASYLLGGNYRLTIGANAALSVILALSVVVVTGYAGQFSLAAGCFYGIGGYGTAIMTVRYGFPPLVAAVAAAALSGLVAYAIGRPLLRLSGHFLAMGTLAVNEIFILLLLAFPAITGGNDGIGGVPPISISGWSLDRLNEQFIVAWMLAGLCIYLVARFGRSRMGRALTFIRSDEAGAASVGINVARVKAEAFALSAILASIAGSLYAHFLSFVSPEPFGVQASIQVLVIAVLGGLATPWGALIGGVGYALIHEVITKFGPVVFGEAGVGPGNQLFVGLVLVLFLIVRPRGLASFIAPLVAQRPIAAAPHGLPRAQTASQTDRPVPVGNVLLQGVGLTKRFGGIVSLSDFSINVRAGEVLGLIGPNGAGKSTLIHVLSGALPPTAGQIRLMGADVTMMPAFRRAAGFRLGRTFQTPKLITGATVFTNAAVGAHRLGRIGTLGSLFPIPAGTREESDLSAIALEGLRWVGLERLIDQDAGTLSLGHRRLLEIGRVLAQRPQIVLLDEPAAGLTRVEKDELFTLLDRMRHQGMGLLLVEHDMELVMRLADRVQVLEFGKTIFEGLPAAAREDERVVAAYLGTSDRRSAP